MVERRIVEQTGKGIVCYISNYSWLDGLSFPAMHERYLDVFDQICIDNLNGDKYKTGKTTPEGAPDPSILSTEWNREGIQVGTAISLLVRKEAHAAPATVQYRNLWGTSKHQKLMESIGRDHASEYQQSTPHPRWVIHWCRSSRTNPTWIGRFFPNFFQSHSQQSPRLVTTCWWTSIAIASLRGWKRTSIQPSRIQRLNTLSLEQ